MKGAVVSLDSPTKITKPSKPTEEMFSVLAGVVIDQSKLMLNVPDDVAKALADEVVTSFFGQYGGKQRYIPFGVSWHSSRLHEQVFAAFNGTNIQELHERFGISTIYVHRIIKSERDRLRTARQANLPGL